MRGVEPLVEQELCDAPHGIVRFPIGELAPCVGVGALGEERPIGYGGAKEDAPIVAALDANGGRRKTRFRDRTGTHDVFYHVLFWFARIQCSSTCAVWYATPRPGGQRRSVYVSTYFSITYGTRGTTTSQLTRKDLPTGPTVTADKSFRLV